TMVTATDSDSALNVLSFSIAGGADAGRFTIDSATGALSFLAAPGFENPQDSGADNIYDVKRKVSDGTNIDTQAIAVTVTNINDSAPVITSDGGGATASIAISENVTTVTIVTATDPDTAPNAVSFSIAGGADAGRFTIDSATGALSF